MPIRRGIMASGMSLRPSEPTLGTITTSISSPNTVLAPSMTQDENNANFSWTNPGAGGVTLGIPFTSPTSNGGLTITNYEYSTDNGSTWKSAGTTTSPISVTTASGSSANLSAATSYTVRLRAVNGNGPGTASSGSAQTTPTAVTSYTIRVYDNYPTNDELVETITGNTTGTYSRSHFKAERDWSITVSAVNTNGAGTYSAESSTATGWRYTAYNADYGRTRSCTRSADCASCGTKTGTEDGTVARNCYQWTRTGSTSETGLACVYRTVPGGTEEQNTTWAGNCRDLGGCSGSWSAATGDFSTGGIYYTYAGPAGYYFVSGLTEPSVPGCGACSEGCFRSGSYYIESCSLGGVRGHLTPYFCSRCENIFGDPC